MSSLKFLSSPESGTVLAHSHRKTPHGALMAANSRAQAELGLPSDGLHTDGRGQSLRLLRLQHNWDSAALATQACLSLRQLYQLENGETSLFYSTSLRNQAGRRVATILGVQWDALEQPPAAPIQDKQIRLISATAPKMPARTEHSPVPLEIPMGLDKPAVETLVVPTPVTAQISRPADVPTATQPSARKLHSLWTLAGWLLAAAAGAGTGWALALFWGVRL